MSSLNRVSVPTLVPRLAGGAGAVAAVQSPIKQLRRLTLANLLWENVAYESGGSGAEQIVKLIPQCDPTEVINLAVEIRTKQGLRHVPLLLIRELFRSPDAAVRKAAGDRLPEVIQRADEMSEFLALYWKDGKCPIAWQVKRGLKAAALKWDEYQWAKWQGENNKKISLRDVMFLVHVKPVDLEEGALKCDKAARKSLRDAGFERAFETPGEVLQRKVTDKALDVPETREVMLSMATTDAEKKATYEHLIANRKLGALATLKSLRHMTTVGVDSEMIRRHLGVIKPDRILPLNFFAAHQHAPQFAKELERLMESSMECFTKMPGHTVMILDASGSMSATVSSKSEFTRYNAACALALMAQKMAERCTIYVTGGDYEKHITAKVPPHLEGWALKTHLEQATRSLGGGGIFTRQVLEHAKKDLGEEGLQLDRIIVISDSQDCDRGNKKPAPFARNNYIVDVSSHKNGINYAGVWTSEISGWSQSFLEYIAQMEALDAA